MIDASRAVLSAATRLCVTSRTAAVIRIPSLVSIADSEISAGNVLPSRRRPARSIPAPIGRGLGLAAYLSRWAGCTPKRDHVGGTCAGEAPASALAASALAASALAAATPGAASRSPGPPAGWGRRANGDRKSTRLNSSHVAISYAVFCLKKKK